MPQTHPVRAYAALAIGVIAIAWSAIFVRWTLMPGVASAFYRAFFASAVLWPLLLFSKKKRLPVSRSTLWIAALGGAFFAGDIGFYNIAVLHTSAGSATFLGNNAPVLVGLLTWAITKKLPSARFWMALLIASAGASLIVAVDAHQDARHLASASAADLLAVLASICFALYLMVTERLREDCDTLTLLALSTTASAATLLLFAIPAHVALAIPGLAPFAALLGLALVCQLTGYFCLTYALGHLPATITALIMLAVAPLTAIFAFLLFGERMSTLQLLGGAFVLLGVWIVTGADRTHRPTLISE
jgi:drug/metabolite transporter (DMT)-like permease